MILARSSDDLHSFRTAAWLPDYSTPAGIAGLVQQVVFCWTNIVAIPFFGFSTHWQKTVIANIFFGHSVFIALLFALIFASWRAELRLAERLDEHLFGQLLSSDVCVASLVQQQSDRVRFIAEPLNRRSAIAGFPPRLEVSIYANGAVTNTMPEILPGQCWRMPLRLQPIHGFANPHGFDYEFWMLSRGIGGRASVSSKAMLLPLTERHHFSDEVNRLRQSIRQRLLAANLQEESRALLAALSIGDRSLMSSEMRQRYQRLGLAHLVAISGMHIGFVALAAALLAGFLWHHNRWLISRITKLHFTLASGLVCALPYAILAGLSLATTRSIIMLGMAVLLLILGRRLSGGTLLALAAILILLFDPWASISAGFYLSFGAVALLIFSAAAATKSANWRSRWWLFVRLQLLFALFGLPVNIFLFQYYSSHIFFANLLLIPLVSLLLLPLLMLWLLFPWSGLLGLVGFLADGFGFISRTLAASLPALEFITPSTLPALGVGLLACLLLLLPRANSFRVVAIVLLFSLLLYRPPRPVEGEALVRVLDVGQGLAIHVQTQSKDMLFDSGAKIGANFDIGEYVLLPYFRQHGVKQLDHLVISHADSDHSGGAAAVIKHFPTAKLWTSKHDLLFMQQRLSSLTNPWQWHSCSTARQWWVDGIKLTFLAQDQRQQQSFSKRKRNNFSCVLLVESAGGSVLLAADIQHQAEAALLTANPQLFNVSVVIAPHHGSNTSSSKVFIRRMAAQDVIYSAAYRSRYGHPHPEVLARWQKAGARQWQTASDGAVSIYLGKVSYEIDSQRQQRRRYW